MMNYEQFKETVKENFMNYILNNFKDMKPLISQVKKVNSTFDAIGVKGDNTSAFPTIYINDMYKVYQNGTDLETILTSACDVIARAYDESLGINVKDILANASDNIFFMLINTEQNQSLLNSVPHRSFHDLSITYRIMVKFDKNGLQAIPITNGLAAELKMTEEQLFKCAENNTQRLFPPTVKTMRDAMRKVFISMGMTEDFINKVLDRMSPEPNMWIISNASCINGASSILYENELHELAEKMESNLYILPSSIHEVVVISAEMGNPEDLALMVAKINVSEVPLEDRLSNQVYHYDRNLRILTIATNTPNTW
jgi:hypothetical protein